MAKKTTTKKPTRKTIVVLPRRAFSVPAGDPYDHPRSGRRVTPTRMVTAGIFLEVDGDFAAAHEKMGNCHVCSGRSTKAKAADARKVYSATRKEMFRKEHPGAPKIPSERTLGKIYGTVSGTVEDEPEVDPDQVDEETTEDD